MKLLSLGSLRGFPCAATNDRTEVKRVRSILVQSTPRLSLWTLDHLVVFLMEEQKRPSWC